MPNIKLIGTDYPDALLEQFMAEVDKQVQAQTGRGYAYSIRKFDGVTEIHFDVEDLPDSTITEGEKKLQAIYRGKVHAGTTGAYSIGTGKLRKALKIFLEAHGYNRVKFKGVFP